MPNDTPAPAAMTDAAERYLRTEADAAVRFKTKAHVEPDDINAVLAELARLRGEVARLREAAEPFAKAAKGIPPNWPGDCSLTWHMSNPNYPSHGLCLGYHHRGMSGGGPKIDDYRRIENLAAPAPGERDDAEDAADVRDAQARLADPTETTVSLDELERELDLGERAGEGLSMTDAADWELIELVGFTAVQAHQQQNKCGWAEHFEARDAAISELARLRAESSAHQTARVTAEECRDNLTQLASDVLAFLDDRRRGDPPETREDHDDEDSAVALLRAAVGTKLKNK